MTPEQIPEHTRARQWRETAGLSRQQLARLTGFSISAIQDYERGAGKDGAQIPKTAMQRYRLACAAIAWKKTAFDWNRSPA